MSRAPLLSLSLILSEVESSLTFALVNLVLSRELLRFYLGGIFRDFLALRFFGENFFPPYYRRSLRLRRYYGNLRLVRFVISKSILGVLLVNLSKTLVTSSCLKQFIKYSRQNIVWIRGRRFV